MHTRRKRLLSVIAGLLAVSLVFTFALFWPKIRKVTAPEFLPGSFRMPGGSASPARPSTGTRRSTILSPLPRTGQKAYWRGSLTTGFIGICRKGTKNNYAYLESESPSPEEKKNNSSVRRDRFL